LKSLDNNAKKVGAKKKGKNWGHNTYFADLFNWFNWLIGF